MLDDMLAEMKPEAIQPVVKGYDSQNNLNPAPVDQRLNPQQPSLELPINPPAALNVVVPNVPEPQPESSNLNHPDSFHQNPELPSATINQPDNLNIQPDTVNLNQPQATFNQPESNQQVNNQQGSNDLSQRGAAQIQPFSNQQAPVFNQVDPASINNNNNIIEPVATVDQPENVDPPAVGYNQPETVNLNQANFNQLGQPEPQNNNEQPETVNLNSQNHAETGNLQLNAGDAQETIVDAPDADSAGVAPVGLENEGMPDQIRMINGQPSDVRADGDGPADEDGEEDEDEDEDTPQVQNDQAQKAPGQELKFNPGQQAEDMEGIDRMNQQMLGGADEFGRRNE
eukprot:GHVO01031757.1.p1 GENE.GHVO01031757.1~~GHVO01031757.1.p1  ORF type:complete len:398 (-),score=61.13 GHVO01031757.1:94-1119(-)